VLACVVVWAGCGAPGDPLPPIVNIPARAADLRAIQRGNEVIVTWTAPSDTVEGLPLRDLGRAVVIEADAEADLEQAAREREAVEGLEPGQRAEVKLAVRAEPGRKIYLAVRHESRRGRWQGLSNVAAVEIAVPPAAPARVEARAHPEGVRVEWEAVAGASGYQVWRQSVLVGRVSEPAFLDRDVKWKESYRYFVRPVAQTSTGATEGLDSRVVEVTPEDRFPPAAPAGLQAVGTKSAAELAWNLSPEADAAGYRVWRDGTRLTIEPLAAPAYTDRTVERGRSYSYEVAAVDREGNESPRSAAARVTVP